MRRIIWAFVGVVFGIASAHQWLQAISAADLSRTSVPSDFFENLVQGTIEDQPQLYNITIHPTSTGYRVIATERQFVQSVLSTDEIVIDLPEKIHPISRCRPTANELSFIEYMRWAKSNFPWVHYNYEWWEQPFWLIGGTALLAGAAGFLIWPTALDLLAGYSASASVETQDIFSTFAKKLWSEGRQQTGRSPTRKSPRDVAAINKQSVHDSETESEPGRSTGVLPQSANLRLAVPTDPQPPSPLTSPTSNPKHFGGSIYPTELHPDD